MSTTSYKLIRVSKETHDILASKGNLYDSFDSGKETAGTKGG
jgi:hypothetical protein